MAESEFDRDYPISESDGLRCRKSGAWAREKLVYLARYMNIVNTSMKGKWEGRGYLDLLSGPGRCKDSQGEFDGSPLVALNQKHSFTAYRFVEGDPRLVPSLTARVNGRAPVIEGDCNDSRIIDQLREPFTGKVLGLAFIDNLGTDVTLDTIAALTRQRPIDLCITYQCGDVQRNIAQALSGEQPPERWDAFFGPGWRAVAERAAKRNLSGSEIANELLEHYGAQLGRLGYDHIAHVQTTMKNTLGVPLYRLVLASRHPRGKEFFEKIAKIEPSGQRRLL